jgi:hypothetical protein
MHPSLRESAEAFAALTLGNYPAQPAEQPLNLLPTYRGVVARLAAHPDVDMYLKPQHLPELSHAELGAVLQFYPEVWLEALAERDMELRAILVQTLMLAASPQNRQTLVGLEIIETMRRYALPLVLRDVQAQVELDRECARLDLKAVMSS